ncbi:MAG: NADP-dependent malic enzyme, partial [Rubrivivax sp.]
MSSATPLSDAEQALSDAALEYHRLPSRGKIAVTPTKPLSNQRDLSLAYSPGVAYPCLAIEKDPGLAFDFTSRGNLVGVITNGTAVLGLGDIGPLASKPVMEGKGCLFKKFAGVDVFDIELAERDPDKLVDIIAALEPTLGGINLEDIKAPECFYIEKKLVERVNIPVFHDDQHGTAIISSAALLNGLELVGKQIGEVKLAVSGAGAAAIACLDLMVGLGVRRENVFVCDSKGVIHTERADKLDESKRRYAQPTRARTLADAVKGADVFLGCSAAGTLTVEMVKTMGTQPIILALANPEPEIRPELAKAARPDCIIATGRSDYPNQVNNVLCFPYIFRGALDCGATKITEAMKLACVRQIADLAKAETSDEVAAAYPGRELRFGPDYLIPTPFDSRLILRIAPAVAEAAAASGVATRPIKDIKAYRESLSQFVTNTGLFMRPVFMAAQAAPKRIAYSEGEDERVLRAAQVAVDEGIAFPILVGRPDVIATRIERAGLRLQPGVNCEVVNPGKDDRFKQYYEAYHALRARDGITPDLAKVVVRRSNSLIATMMVKLGDADGMIGGVIGRYDLHLEQIREVIGVRPGAHGLAALNALILDQYSLFIADTFVNE